MAITFVTGNPNKLREAKQILGMELDSADIDIDEIQAIAVEEVAKDKAIKAYHELKKPVIVEDTGLYIKEYNNFPGALVKWMIKQMGRDEMAKLFCGKSVTAECCICFYDGKHLEVFKGDVNGTLSMPVGGSNFGWDPIFKPEGFGKTFAEMTADEKNSISHRGKAFRAAREFLKSYK